MVVKFSEILIHGQKLSKRLACQFKLDLKKNPPSCLHKPFKMRLPHSALSFFEVKFSVCF